MPARADLPPTVARLVERQAVLFTGDPGEFPQSIVDAILPIIRRWQSLAICDEAGTTTWTHRWHDIAWLTNKDGWLCGAISEGGAGGHVGYGILLRTMDGGRTWKRATKILSGHGGFNWGGFPYNWTDVGPIYSILLYPRERTGAKKS
jgi:hypothetical protein